MGALWLLPVLLVAILVAAIVVLVRRNRDDRSDAVNWRSLKGQGQYWFSMGTNTPGGYFCKPAGDVPAELCAELRDGPLLTVRQMMDGAFCVLTQNGWVYVARFDEIFSLVPMDCPDSENPVAPEPPEPEISQGR